jgi:hypothetical protein
MKDVFVNKKIQCLVTKTYSTLSTKVVGDIVPQTMRGLMVPLWKRAAVLFHNECADEK